MTHLTDHKMQRVLTRFPWRRRKPRGKSGGPIAVTMRDGQRLWADAGELAKFDDPGPALVCVAMRSDPIGHTLVRDLVFHHAQAQGIELPPGVPAVTTSGLEVLDKLIASAGLDPDEEVGSHRLGELLTATWAIAAATELPA